MMRYATIAGCQNDSQSGFNDSYNNSNVPVTTQPLPGGGTVTVVGNGGNGGNGNGGATVYQTDNGAAVVGGGGGNQMTIVSSNNNNGGGGGSMVVSGGGPGFAAAGTNAGAFNPFAAVFGSMAAAGNGFGGGYGK